MAQVHHARETHLSGLASWDVTNKPLPALHFEPDLAVGTQVCAVSPHLNRLRPRRVLRELLEVSLGDDLRGVLQPPMKKLVAASAEHHQILWPLIAVPFVGVVMNV
jgi:hypothetical protein